MVNSELPLKTSTQKWHDATSTHILFAKQVTEVFIDIPATKAKIIVLVFYTHTHNLYICIFN